MERGAAAGKLSPDTGGFEQAMFAPQMCCDTTTRQAAHLGFTATILSDATAAMSVTGPDGVTIPHDVVHRTHLGSLSGVLADIKRSAEIPAG